MSARWFVPQRICFGVATVLGALAGALAAALMMRKFRLAGFADSADTVRNLAGGALMGTGGITALGCTIGQGVTGLSTLALGSVLGSTMPWQRWRARLRVDAQWL